MVKPLLRQKKMAQPWRVAPNPPKEEGGGDKAHATRIVAAMQ
jgi:hypothetical protein